MDKDRIVVQSIDNVIINFIRYNGDIKESLDEYHYDNIIYIKNNLIFNRSLIRSILNKLSTKENKYKELILAIDFNDKLINNAKCTMIETGIESYKGTDDIKEFISKFIYDKLITILNSSDIRLCNILIAYPSNLNSYMEFIRYNIVQNNILVKRMYNNKIITNII